MLLLFCIWKTNSRISDGFIVEEACIVQCNPKTDIVNFYREALIEQGFEKVLC